MSQYFDKNNLFLEPKVKQYGSHMVMTNVHKPLKTKYINLDTRFSDDYNDSSATNYNLTLPERINEIKSITVTNIELPMSFYNISSSLGNNSFQIVNHSINGSAPYLNAMETENRNDNNEIVDTIIIPDGNYSISDLKTTINAEMDKLNRVPKNANGMLVVNSSGNIVYESNGTTMITLTNTNAPFDTNGELVFDRNQNGDYILDSYGNFRVTLLNSNLVWINGAPANTNDLQFDYYTKGSGGIQCYFYSNRSNITVHFAVNEKGTFDKYNFKAKLGWIMGFRKISCNISYSSQSIVGTYDPMNGFGPAGQPLTYGEFLADLNSLRYVYLAMDEFNKGAQNSFISPTHSSLLNKNIIARISLDRSNYGFGTYLPANNQNGLLLSDRREYNGKIDLHKLKLQIVNEMGIPLPLNGFDFSLCLELEHD
jgi:hypothetical protein